MKKTHPSVKELTQQYYQSLGKPFQELESFYFCDNKKDADECAELVLSGDKRATATSHWWFEINNEKLPATGDIYVVTNWEGLALCVIQVEKIELVPFNEVTEEFAYTEGEGDKSLKYWKEVHWDYYHRELADSKFKPTEDMIIVCEYFRKVYS